MYLGGRFDTAFVPTETESGRALMLMNRDLPQRPLAFHLVFGSQRMPVTDPAFRAEVERALAPLAKDPRVAAVRTGWNANPPEPDRFSRDGHHTRVSVELKGHTAAVESMVFVADGAETYAALRPLVRSDVLSVTSTGALALHYDFTEITRRDVVRAELVILPVVPILLLLVFGSVVAAAVPFGVGLLAVAGGMAATFLMSKVIAVSPSAVTVTTLPGPPAPNVY